MENPSSEPQPTQPQPAATTQPQKSPAPESPETHSGLMWGIFACFVVMIVILFAVYFFGFYPWKIETSETVTTVTNANVTANTNSAVNTNSAINTNNSNTNTNATNTNAPKEDTASNTLGMEDATVAYISTRGPEDGGPLTLRKIPLDTPTTAESLSEINDATFHDAYDDKVLYTSLSPNILYEYDATTKTTKALVTLKSKHIFGGVKVSPDKTKLVYTDQCGFDCDDSGDFSNSTTVIRMLNLQTLKQEDLFSEQGRAQGYKGVNRWLDNNTVILRPRFEATEGAQTIPEVELLDIETKKIAVFSLDPNARYFSAAANGTKIAYTTFTGDVKNQTHTSTLVIKYIDGSRTDVIETSDKLEYREVFWMASGNSDPYNEGVLALMTSTVDELSEGIGYDVTGTKALYFSVESNWTMGKMASDSRPEWILSAGVNHVVFTEKVDNNFIRVKVYNLNTGKTDTAIDNIRSAYPLPARFE